MVTTDLISEAQDATGVRAKTMVSLSSPVSAADIQTAWPALQQALTAQFDDFAARDAQALLAFCDSVRAQGGQGWTVRFDEVPVGCLALTPMTPVACSLVVLLDFHQDAELNQEAIQLALIDAFAERKTLQHICSTAFLEGEASVSCMLALEQLGARHQGVLRSQTLRGGALADVYLLGFLRSEFFTEARSACGG